jgi:hypothetical protein
MQSDLVRGPPLDDLNDDQTKQASPQVQDGLLRGLVVNSAPATLQLREDAYLFLAKLA